MVNNQLKGIIFNIQKFSIHDGHGIRTLIFMKGCPLKCIWCSNPESQRYEKEIMFVTKNCTGCGKCAALCLASCIDETTFAINRDDCIKCGQCTRTCYANAKKVVGMEISIYDILKAIEKDRLFYRNSEGGVTIGGGEPTAQPEFVSALLGECKRLSLHTAIETCGHGKWENIGKVLSLPDQVFYDLKHMDPEKHKAMTGVDNRWILENAARIVDNVDDITFRLPLVPGCNDSEDNILETGKFVKSLMKKRKDIRLELLPYHALGADKYRWMGLDYELVKTKAPSQKSVEGLNSMLKDIGCNVI